MVRRMAMKTTRMHTGTVTATKTADNATSEEATRPSAESAVVATSVAVSVVPWEVAAASFANQNNHSTLSINSVMQGMSEFAGEPAIKCVCLVPYFRWEWDATNCLASQPPPRSSFKPPTHLVFEFPVC